MRGRFSLFAKQSPLKRRLHFFFFYQQNKELTEAAALYPTTHITQKKLFQSKKEQHHVICCRLAGSADHQSSENQQQHSSSSILSNSAAISSSAGGGTLSAQWHHSSHQWRWAAKVILKIARWRNKNPSLTTKTMLQYPAVKVAAATSSSGPQPPQQSLFRPFPAASLTCFNTWEVTIMSTTSWSHTQHWALGIPLNSRWIKSVSLLNVLKTTTVFDRPCLLCFCCHFFMSHVPNLYHVFHTRPIW